MDEFLHAADRLEILLIALKSQKNMVDMFDRSGYNVRFNPEDKGNCQFDAISDQLRRLNISGQSGGEIRQSVAN